MGILQALYWRSRERRKEGGGREGRKREGEKKGGEKGSVGKPR